MDEEMEGGAKRELAWQTGRRWQEVQREEESWFERNVEGGGYGLGYGEGGVEKEERSEGRPAGSMYICHPLLLQAKNAQEELGRRKKSRRTGRGRQVGALCHQQEEHY